jgi:hypothetical protein
MKATLVSILLILIVSRAFAVRPEPQAQIDSFFKTLGDKGASAAIDSLCKGTLLESQKKSELSAFPPQLDAGLKIYGKIVRTENVEKKSFGESFLRIRVISYHESGAPLFWEFLFFKGKNEWQIYIFQFNDQFHKAFSNA